MYLSSLQKKILFECYFRSGKISFEEIIKSYKGRAIKNIKGLINKSLKRLIKKELVSALVKKTPHKSFIKEIRLTKLGKQLVKEILDQKQKLPFKIKK